MPLNEQLTPISFHLRHFNKYTKLDIAASQMGYITLIGENAVGKTTLANCFFPMLIDGSIATPSFNAAKGTDHLDKTARNSSQDARNFDSMLLGWGADAMKVRTGYSYLRLQSKRRQVILGIGATRTVGNPSKPTWWFMAINQNPTARLELVTTDTAGKSLDKAGFKAANETLGIPLQIFDSATTYRDQVATQVYGFDGGSALNKLASAYRLLASPILTAGNAKFTPIIEALKNAQEGIDPQTISRIADSQREVNYTNGLLERLNKVEKRLYKIKKDVFWSNLNRLDELILKRYTDAQQRLEQQQIKLDTARGIIEDCERQLITVRSSIQQALTKLQRLREQQAAQAVIEKQREQLQIEMVNLNQQLTTYQAQLRQLAMINQQLTVVERDLADNAQQQVDVKTKQLSPLRAKLDQHSATLSELRQVMTEIDLTELAERLRKYVQLQKLTQTKYTGLTSQIEQGSHDVKIVSHMKGQLDSAIDERVQGTLSGGRIREGLHEDNQTIHDQGASEMDERVKSLVEQRNQLMIAHPDLKALLADSTLLSKLSKGQKELTKTLQQLNELQRTAK